MEIAGPLAYLADGISGVKILDVSQPTRPALVGTFETAGNTRSVRVRENLAYVADLQKGLLILDVSKPAAPARGSR